mmetsp:Transcript_11270/g.26485  ORF Transcript_11270/g.26485 Transcript_11270/m.26485 type:complete len:249 (-) Transcript_11270:20-766(-)
MPAGGLGGSGGEVEGVAAAKDLLHAQNEAPPRHHLGGLSESRRETAHADFGADPAAPKGAPPNEAHLFLDLHVPSLHHRHQPHRSARGHQRLATRACTCGGGREAPQLCPRRELAPLVVREVAEGLAGLEQLKAADLLEVGAHGRRGRGGRQVRFARQNGHEAGRPQHRGEHVRRREGRVIASAGRVVAAWQWVRVEQISEADLPEGILAEGLEGAHRPHPSERAHALERRQGGHLRGRGALDDAAAF